LGRSQQRRPTTQRLPDASPGSAALPLLDHIASTCHADGVLERGRQIIYRVVGNPPSKAGPRLATFRWLRRLYLLWFLPLLLVLFATVAVTGAPQWLWMSAAVCAVTWLWGFASISYQIARQQRSHG
jgi:hypothetical protein